MAATPDEDEAMAGLRMHSTSPEKTVFTEPDNNDGWIATDFTVDVER
ncbi:MAG: hypothetical protein ACI8UR_000362 [Natronomonas sp.]|jgi:hypothetical protein